MTSLPRRFRITLSLALLVLSASLVPGMAAAQVPGPRHIDADVERFQNSAMAERMATEDPVRGRVVAAFVRGPVSPDALRAMGAEVGTIAGDVITVRVPLSAVPQIAHLPGVTALRLATPLKKHLDAAVTDAGAGVKRTTSPPLLGWNGNNVVVGLVDSGIEYQHQDFKNPDGTTRLLSIWDQNAIGSPPAGFAYGNECTQAQINAGTCGQTDPYGHGTHVAGIAAGDGSATGNSIPQYKYVGMANKANIVCVATDFSDAGLVDGVNYIFQKAASLGLPAVVNMSLGTNLGPHDGTTDLEYGLQNLVGTGRILVASAGNEATAATHARLTSTAANDSCSFSVPTYTGSAVTDFFVLDGWYEGSDSYQITLISPTGKVYGPVIKGNRYIAPASGADPQNADGRVYLENAFAVQNNGDANVYIEVSDLSGAPKPRNGTWRVRVRPVSVVSAGKVHFWSYSNLSPTYLDGTFTFRQTGDETISSPSTADSVICVGAHVTKASWISSAPGQPGPWGFGETLNQICTFSSNGPRRDGVMKPDLSAPGSAVASALSTQWAALGADYDPRLVVDDGVHVVLQGTSMSAPMVTGAVAMMLQQDPNLNPTLARQRLTANTRKDAAVTGAGAVPNKKFGWGKLDLTNVLPALDTTAPTVSVTRPVGGETFTQGTQQAINWTASDNIGVTSIDLEYTNDNGLNWEPIAAGLANSGSYLWTVPNDPTTQARVRVTAHDTQNQSQAASANVFTITNGVDAGPAPLAFAVRHASPSPFTNLTTIGFDLPAVSGSPGGTWPVKVRIYNIAGREVRTLIDADLAPGTHTAAWDGKDRQGLRQPSGVYFVEVTTPRNEGRVRAVYLR